MGTFSTLDDLVNPEVILDPIMDRAESAQLYAENVQALANAAILQLAESGDDFLGESIYDDITDDLFDIASGGLSGLNLINPTEPDINIPVIANPSTVIPELPEMDDSDIDSIIGEVPAFSASRPAITIPDLPDDDFPVFNESAPTLSDIDKPSAPDFTLPTIPKIDDVSIPSPPEYNTASFEGVMPTADLTPPETMFVYNEAEYSSALKDKLAEKLLYDLINGGTGLNEETEQAIWDRATSRQEDENEAAINEAMNFWASRGFSMPVGALNGTIIEVSDRIRRRKDDLNNDILVQQSKLAQENTHFAISEAIQMEKNLMDNANQVQNRAFESAKATVELAAVVYKVKTEQYIAQLEGYKVQAQVFEIKIRAEIAKAEFYKARIEGIKASVGVKELLVQAYNSQIEGIKALIQMYATQMDAAKIEADIDLTKLEAYKAQADVFATKTAALTSKYNAYQSQLAGEKTKADIYLADVQAYTALVGGFKAAAEVESTKADVKLAKHQADITGYKASIDRYLAESNRLMAKAETQIKAEGLKVESYKGDIQKYQSDIDAIVKEYLGRVDSAKARADVLIKEREVAVQKMLGEKGITTESIIAQAKVASQLAAAALTSISASTSLGLSQSQTTSKSTSETDTHSNSYSESHQHNYQH